jgi:DNA-directed RNA polymerase subunit E'/Rpb7
LKALSRLFDCFFFSSFCQVFVPEDHMPGDYDFVSATGLWHSADETVAIKEGSGVRLRVLQVKPLDGFCLGSIRDDFLGLRPDQQ